MAFCFVPFRFSRPIVVGFKWSTKENISIQRSERKSSSWFLGVKRGEWSDEIWGRWTSSSDHNFPSLLRGLQHMCFLSTVKKKIAYHSSPRLPCVSSSPVVRAEPVLPWPFGVGTQFFWWFLCGWLLGVLVSYDWILIKGKFLIQFFCYFYVTFTRHVLKILMKDVWSKKKKKILCLKCNQRSCFKVF